MIDKITTNIKLISSINEVVLTLGRVILQDYSVVIATLTPKNKLIFKVKDKEEYLYGNDMLINFQCVREALKKRERISLEMM